MKRYYLYILLIVLCCSCIKDANGNKSTTAQVQEQSLFPESVRGLDSAMDWARKSITLLDGGKTKSGLTRKIESWNALVVPGTKSGNAGPDTLLYVFNFADNSGFSIIAAAPTVKPILAVTESGHYVAGEPTGNEAFDEYMRGLSEYLPNQSGKPELYYWYDSVMDGEVVNRNVGVSWGQDDIYGQYCPNGLSGCVATAMAQIMAYHCVPSSFYATTSIGSEILSGESVPLNWSGIKKHSMSHTDTRPCDSYHKIIGALLREIGSQVDMRYDSGESTASFNNVPGAFNHFGYIASSPVPFSVNTAKSAIKSFGPIYMRGGLSANGNGHAWIIDGYADYKYYYNRYERAEGSGKPPIITQQTLISKEHAFHINWGWDGDCNGYFDIGVFDVDKANTYDDTHNHSGLSYANECKMVIVARDNTLRNGRFVKM